MRKAFILFLLVLIAGVFVSCNLDELFYREESDDAAQEEQESAQEDASAEEEYFCPECGAKITLDTKVCPNCGIELEFAEDEE